MTDEVVAPQRTRETIRAVARGIADVTIVGGSAYLIYAGIAAGGALAVCAGAGALVAGVVGLGCLITHKRPVDAVLGLAFVAKFFGLVGLANLRGQNPFG